jgi:hypothetical protein
MRSLALIGLLLVGACALPASHLNDVVSVNPTRRGEEPHGLKEVAALLIGAAFVLIVIPGLQRWGKP